MENKINMTKAMIEALERKGFRRWTKGEYDRLYANAKDFGLWCEYYSSGNVKSATLNGDPISNRRAGGILFATKIWINVETGDLCVSRGADEDILANVKAAIEEATAEVAGLEDEPEEPAPETNLTGTRRQIEEAQEIINAHIANVQQDLKNRVKAAERREAKGTEDALRMAADIRAKIEHKKQALEWLLNTATSAEWWFDHGNAETGLNSLLWTNIVKKHTNNQAMDLDYTPVWMRRMGEPEQAKPKADAKAASTAPVCAIGKLQDGWNDLGSIALTKAGEDRLLELICDRLPDEVSLGVPNTFYAPADYDGDFDVNEILSAAQEQIMQEDGPCDAPYWEVD